MDTTETRTTQTVVLNRNQITHAPFGFEFKSISSDAKGQLAKVIASSFLKFCERATQPDTVEGFMEQFDVYQELLGEAEQFIQTEVAIVQDNRPLNELLLNFATYRLGKVSRAYYYESLTVRDRSEVAPLKARVKDCQKDFDNLLQSL